MQEAARLLPKSDWHLSLCSKAWSDLTYMDEIEGQFKEDMNDQIKRDVNEKAFEYSAQACYKLEACLSELMLLHELLWLKLWSTSRTSCLCARFGRSFLGLWSQ